jgi:microcystin-dependent protein
MATITGLTAQRMLEIEAASVVDGEVVSGNLILSTHGGVNIDAGSVLGPAGPIGPVGPVSSIPGEIKLWPGGALPDLAQYGKWVWADGAVYVAATYPKAAANIASSMENFLPEQVTLGQLTSECLMCVVLFQQVWMQCQEVLVLIAWQEQWLSFSQVDQVRKRILSRSPRLLLMRIRSLLRVTHIQSTIHSMRIRSAIRHIITRCSDPTHTHTGILGAGSSAVNYGNQQAVPDATPMTPNNSATGIGIYAALTGIAIYAAATGIGIYSAYAGINGTNNAGGSGAHENVQPTVFVPYIVCLNG